MRTEEVFTVYNPANKVICCGVDLSFDQLIPINGYKFYDSRKKVWETTINYCCPNCIKSLVYDRKGGYPLELVVGQASEE